MSDDSINVTVAVRLSLLEDKVDRLLAVQAEADARQRLVAGLGETVVAAQVRPRVPAHR